MDALTAPLAEDGLRRRQVAPPQGAGAAPATPPPFDAKAQYVSNQGDHKFIAPGPNDQRGQCPGLNAMANHGYLPRNGIATIQQFITGTYQVFGMGQDLATFLAVYGAVIDGTGTSWSIGGVPHTGIAGSHGNYETDSSPLKSDLNQYGSLGKLVISQYKTLRDMQPNTATANYNLEVLRAFRGKRFQESIDKNPYFSYTPFAGQAVSQAAFTFIYRFMANKSAEYPEGRLDRNTLKSFMSITGTDANPIWTPGNEKIPDNWYKRNDADQYTIPYFLGDIQYFGETQPEIFSLGCNTGTVDSYSVISPEAISNGAYTTQQAAKNPLCFSLAFAVAELPLFTGVQTGSLLTQLSGVTSKLGCATIASVNQSAFGICPGFSLYGGPTGPVAPGAIQS
ncbi:hypothetical protein K431DRAFT_214138 [Polychaeton citri CBS 116435]|uniref:Heme haloperoxidase family profile domain-containing protein n=1 Tax=Polychaeton citri CBS 116435 TaxID=1314669 RepID=A0A9P4QJN7_9PEZI|nr:hypothetical protein K431DRAFT_214138 [Polychaeton citri CBS 116435]